MAEFRNEQFARAAKLYSTQLIDDCFHGPKRRPSDIDSVAVVAGPGYVFHSMKRNNFLYFECKVGNAPMLRSQRILYGGLADILQDKFTLFVISHECLVTKSINGFDNVNSLEIVRQERGRWQTTGTMACRVDGLRFWCSEWELMARGLPNEFSSLFLYASGQLPRVTSDNLDLAGLGDRIRE